MTKKLIAGEYGTGGDASCQLPVTESQDARRKTQDGASYQLPVPKTQDAELPVTSFRLPGRFRTEQLEASMASEPTHSSSIVTSPSSAVTKTSAPERSRIVMISGTGCP